MNSSMEKSSTASAKTINVTADNTMMNDIVAESISKYYYGRQNRGKEKLW